VATPKTVRIIYGAVVVILVIVAGVVIAKYVLPKYVSKATIEATIISIGKNLKLYIVRNK
jgi:hypothetical protein